jgi:hypothetical protein
MAVDVILRELVVTELGPMQAPFLEFIPEEPEGDHPDDVVDLAFLDRPNMEPVNVVRMSGKPTSSA